MGWRGANRRATAVAVAMAVMAVTFVDASGVSAAPGADLAVTVDVPVSVVADDVVSGTVSVANVGTGAGVAPSVWIDVRSGSGPVGDVVASGEGWTCTEDFGLVCRRPAAESVPAAGALPPIALTFTAPHAPSVVVEAYTDDPFEPDEVEYDNNSAEATIAITGAEYVDLGAAITAVGAPFEPSSGAAFSVTVRNDGSVTTTDPVAVVLGTTGDAPAASGSGWTCADSGTEVQCDLATPLAPGAAAAPITFTAAVPDGAVEVEAWAFVLTTFGDDPANDYASATGAVRQARDAAIAISDGGVRFRSGGQARYDVTVTNVGTDALPGPFEVTIDTVLEAPVLTGTGWSCTTLAFPPTCTRAGPVAAGSSLPPIAVTGTVPEFLDQAYAYVTVSTADDTNFDNDWAELETPIDPGVDLVIEASTVATTATVGGTVSIDLLVSNIGPQAASGEVEVSWYAEELASEEVAPTGTGWTCEFYRCTHPGPVAGGGNLPALTLNGTLGPSWDRTFDLYVEVFNASDQLGPNDDRLSLPLIAPIDLAPVIDDGDRTFVADEPGTYEIVVANGGTSPSTGEVTVALTVPTGDERRAGTRIVDASGSGWVCDLDVDACTSAATIAAGAASAPITVAVVADGTFDGETWLQAELSGGGDSILGDDVVWEPTPVTPGTDVVVSMTTDGPFLAGRTGTYVVEVANTLGGDAAGEVTVEVRLGRAFTPDAATATGTGWACERVASRLLSCSRPGPVAGGATLPPVRVTGPLGAGDSFVYSTATVWTLGDDVHGDNDSFLETEIGGETDLTVEILAPSAPVVFGGIATVPVVVRNVGDTDAGGDVRLAVDLPAGLGGVDATSTDARWTCTVDEFVVDCRHPGPVPGAGSLAPVLISGTVGRTDEGTLHLSTRVAGQFDATGSNDVAERSIPVALPVDLALDIDDDGEDFPITGRGAYLVRVENLGTVATTAPVTVTFEGLGARVDAVTVTPAGWTCVGGDVDVVCRRTGSIEAGAVAAATVEFTVLPTAEGTLFTRARLEQSEDGRADNDLDTETTRLIELLDLAVDIDDAGARFAAPGTGAYRVVVTNAASSAADGPVTVELGAAGSGGVRSASGDGWTCPLAGEVIVCTHDGPVAVRGALPAITFVVDVTVDDGRAITGRAQLFVVGDGIPSNDVDTESTPVDAPADLVVDIVPGRLVVDRVGAVEVTVRNRGTGPTLAPTAVLLDARGSAGGAGWSCVDDVSGLRCSHLASIPAGAALPTLTWSFSPTMDDVPETVLRGSVANTDDGDRTNDTASVTAPVLVAVDLVATTTAGRRPFTAGRTESYAVVVENRGVESAEGVVTLTLDQNRNGFPQVTGDGWDCLTLFGTSSCTHPGPVPAGGSLPALTTTFEATTSDYPAHTLTATVDHPDDVRPGNDITIERVAVLAVDLVVDVEDLGAPDPAVIGSRRQYRITVANTGGLAPTGATTLRIEPGTGLLRAEPGNDSWVCTSDAEAFVCSSTTPAPAIGDMLPLEVDFYVGGGAYPMTGLVARASAPGEADPFDNAGSVATEVTGAPDLVLEAPPTVGPTQAGADATVTYVVRNRGSLPTTGRVDVTADRVEGLTFLGTDSPDWICASDDFAWTCSHPGPVLPDDVLPELAVGFTAGVAAYPFVDLVAAVDNLSDEDPGNNTSTVRMFVDGVVDIELASPLVDGIIGDRHELPLVVRNRGTRAADAPTVVEATTFSAGLTPVSAAGSGWTCTAVGPGFRCVHPGPVPAGGELPELVFVGDSSDTLFDAGQRCRFADIGRGLERVCVEVGMPSSGADVQGIVTNESDLRKTEQSFAVGLRLTQPLDLGVTAGATEQLYMGGRASFALQVGDLGATPPSGLVSVRARFDCGYSFTSAVSDVGGCEPGLVDLGVLGDLEVAGEGWTCAIDALDDRGIVCTRVGVPSGPIPPIVVNADMDPTFRGVFVLRPTVSTAGDTNPYNDHPSTSVLVDRRRLPDGKADLTPFPGRPRQQEYTVGVNDLFQATIVNLGSSVTSGTITIEVELGTGFRFLRDEPDDWACSAAASLVTCTSDVPLDVYDPNVGRGFATATFVVGIDAAALPAVTHRITTRYAQDPIPDNDLRERIDAVFEGPVPTAVLGASRTVVPTPSTVDFDASASENTGPTTVFRWDFGDGTTAFGETASHAYTRAGVYQATLRAYTGARFDTDTVRIVVYPNEPLVADAGDDQVVAEGDVVEFDGGASRPALGIQSHRWDFGDGTTATGRAVSHEFTEPGNYDVTLTVRIGTLTAVDTMRVLVLPAGVGGDGGGLVVQVADPSGTPVRLADVTVYDRNGRRYSARADANGRAVLGTVPSGAYTAYAYRTGYQPGTGRAIVVGGSGTGKVVLQRGAVGEATLEHRRLTLDEIVARGIDVNDPANQNVIEFSINLAFSVDPSAPTPVSLEGFAINGDGEIVEGPDEWLCDPDVCIFEDDDRTIIVDGEDDPEAGPTIVTLVIPGKARFLKEFFEITMIVSNLGPKGFAFTDGAATLDLPAGLALAPMAEPQQLTTPVAPIKAGQNGIIRWIVRGDRAGLYDLGASYSAVLDPVGSSILLSAQTRKPLRVWGADAINIRVRAQRQVRQGRPYRVIVGIENVSDAPIYNAGFDFGDLAGSGSFVYAPWTDRAPTVGEIAPASTWFIELWFIPGFSGELVACSPCEDVLNGPTPVHFGRSLALGARVAADPVVDTNIFGSFAESGASGAASAIDPAAVELESVPDDALAFTAVGAPGVDRLTWEPAPGATGYRVYRVGDATPVAVLGGDRTSAEIVPLAGSRTYVLGTLVDGAQKLLHPEAVVAGAPNRPPTGIDQSAATDPGAPVEIDVLGDEADLEGGPLTVVGVEQPTHGTVTCTPSGQCTYTPEPGFTGTDSFTVTIQDADGGTSTQTVTVVVEAGANHPPIAVADAATTAHGVPVVIDVLANDSDPDDDELSIVGATDGSAGTVACAATCTYTPSAGTSGADLFTYTVSDGRGGTARAAVRVVVAPPSTGNLAPVARFTATVVGSDVTLDGSTSSDDDGRIVAHRWDLGDGSVDSGPSIVHHYAVAGTYEVKLTVVDDLGSESTTTRSVTVAGAPANRPPTAVIGVTIDGLDIEVDGSASSDDDGEIVGYAWEFGDLTTDSGSQSSHRYTTPGTYLLVLRVLDDDGGVGVATREITVAEAGPGNAAPSARFTSTTADLVASFDASSSADDDGTIVSYEWEFGDGTTGTGANPVHTYAAAGTYEVTLTVTDDDGAAGTVTKSVRVDSAPSVPVNLPPLAAFTTTVDGLVVSFDGSTSSDADGAIVGLAWDFGDGTAASGPTPTHTFAKTGAYQVTLTVTDDDGATSSVSRTITVSATPALPTANLAPVASFAIAVDGMSVSFDGRSSRDVDGRVVAYSWDFGDGTTADGPTTTHIFATGGVHLVTLVVTDDDGAVGTMTRTVGVRVLGDTTTNQAPLAMFAIDVDGRTVSVDATGSMDPDGTLSGLSWSFGDDAGGSTLAALRSTEGPPTLLAALGMDEMRTTHTYAADGTYAVVLTVTDDLGATKTARKTVTIGATAGPGSPGSGGTGSGSGSGSGPFPGGVGELPATGGGGPLAVLLAELLLALGTAAIVCSGSNRRKEAR